MFYKGDEELAQKLTMSFELIQTKLFLVLQYVVSFPLIRYHQFYLTDNHIYKYNDYAKLSFHYIR